MANQINYNTVKFVASYGKASADSAFDLPRGELRRPLKRGQVVYHEQDLQSSQSC